jgi:hypothetical protein
MCHTLSAPGSKTREAEFLFDADIVAYVELLRRQALDLRYRGEKLLSGATWSSDAERSKAIDEEGALLKFFTEQIGASPSRFESYLRFATESRRSTPARV